MSRRLAISVLASAGLLVGCASPVPKGAGSGDQKASDFVREFTPDKGDLSATGTNPYFILEPGYQLILDDGRERLVSTVLNETRMVDGVQTRVIEERHTKGGKLVELSRNYFAISKKTNDVYYFGEEVDIYTDRGVTNEGAWLSGEKGAKFGLIMPGRPALGTKYFQEIASGVAMDRFEVISVTETVKTPAGEFKNCLKMEETTPLEPGVKDYKFYCPEIGLTQDGSMKLVKYGKV